MRTTRPGTFGDYYAAEHEPILTTMVLTQTAVHTLRFSASPHTAWDISSIQLIAYPMPKNVRGIGYSPYRDCQTPTSTLQPSAQDIQEDLFRLFHTSNAIRTYASTGVNRLVPALANAAGLPVYAGAWLDKKATDEAELQGLIELANTTKLAGAIVGNEFYLRHTTDADLAYLHDQILRFKAGIHDQTLPVMTAEIDGFMFDWQDDAHGATFYLDDIAFAYDPNMPPPAPPGPRRAPWRRWCAGDAVAVLMRIGDARRGAAGAPIEQSMLQWDDTTRVPGLRSRSALAVGVITTSNQAISSGCTYCTTARITLAPLALVFASVRPRLADIC